MEEKREGERREKQGRPIEGISEEVPQKGDRGLMKEILIYVGAMFLMATIAVVVVTVLLKDKTERDATASEPPASDEKPVSTNFLPDQDAPIYTFEDPIVANTADVGGFRFLKAKIHLILRNTDVKTQIEKSEVLRFHLKDLFVKSFSTKEAAELQSDKGKEELKQHFMTEVNRVLGGGSVMQVYFSEFLIQ